MKNIRLNWSILTMLVLTLVIGTTGCKKAKENAEINAQAAQDFARDMDEMNEIMDMALDIASNDPNISLKKSNESVYLHDKVSLKYAWNDSLLTDGDGLILEISFGQAAVSWTDWENVTPCRDGVKRAGLLKIYVSPDFKDIGGSVVIEMLSFGHGKNSDNYLRIQSFSSQKNVRVANRNTSLKESMSLTRTGANSWSWKCANQGGNKELMMLLQVKNKGEELWSYFAGEGTFTNYLKSDGSLDRVELTGTSEGFTAFQPFYYVTNIKETLVRKIDECPGIKTFVSGIIELSNDHNRYNAKKPLKIDFGNGECDNKADVSQKINAFYTYKETIEF